MQRALPPLEDTVRFSAASGPSLSQFGYAQVALAPGRMQRQFEENHSLLLNMDEDSLLLPFRIREGLPLHGSELGGWSVNSWSGASNVVYVTGRSAEGAALKGTEEAVQWLDLKDVADWGLIVSDFSRPVASAIDQFQYSPLALGASGPQPGVTTESGRDEDAGHVE